MIIYGEYLFLENFITGFMITYFTGKIAGEEQKNWRMVICAMCCGAYSFSLFVDTGGWLSLIGKILFVILAVLIAFGKNTIKRVILNAILFFMITFLYGGITIGLLMAFSWEGIAATGGLYMPYVTYLTVTAAGTAATLFIWLAISVIREKRQAMRNTVETVVCIGDAQWELLGYIDSGNFLTEPLTGRPVAVVSKALMEKMLSESMDGGSRYTVIPYNTVGVEKGILDGYRVDYIKIPGKIIRKPILAVYDMDRKLTEDSRGQILLPRGMLERGIYANFD